MFGLPLVWTLVILAVLIVLASLVGYRVLVYTAASLMDTDWYQKNKKREHDWREVEE